MMDSTFSQFSTFSSNGDAQLRARLKQLERENVSLRHVNGLPTRTYRGGNYPPFENPEMAESVMSQRLSYRPTSARNTNTRARPVSPRNAGRPMSPRNTMRPMSPRVASPRAGEALGERYRKSMESKFGTDHAWDPKLAARMFESQDKDRNATLEKEEMLKAMLAMNVNATPQEMDALMKQADLNGDGVIDFEEFQTSIMKLSRSPFRVGEQPKKAMVLEHELGAATKNQATPKEIQGYIGALRQAIETKYSMLRKAFLAADADRSGYLSKEEVVTTIKHFALPIPLSHIYQIFDEILDKDGDGEVSYTEFCDKLKSSEF